MSRWAAPLELQELQELQELEELQAQPPLGSPRLGEGRNGCETLSLARSSG